MVRIKLFLSAKYLITQYFILNIQFYMRFLCVLNGTEDSMTYMFMVTSRRLIVYEQRNRWIKIFFSGDGEKYCSVGVIIISFLCFDVKV